MSWPFLSHILILLSEHECTRRAQRNCAQTMLFDKRAQAALCAIVCALAMVHAPSAALACADEPELPPLIPRAVLFGNPQQIRPRLSPDGKHIAFLAPLDGVMNIWVAPADDLTAAKPVTHVKGAGVRVHQWAYTNEHILFLFGSASDERFHVFAVSIDGSEPRDLTPFPRVTARIQQLSPKIPDEVLLAINGRDPAHYDLHRVNIRTGAREIVQTNDDAFAAFVTNDDLQVRYAVQFTESGGEEVLQPADDGGWTLFTSIPADDALTTTPIGFSADDVLLYMYDSRDQDTVAITATDTRTGQRALITDIAGADIDGALVHPTTKKLQATSFTRARRRWHAIDPKIRSDLEYLRNVREGDIDIVSRTLDDSKWIVAYIDDDHPPAYFLYDHLNKQATFLFSTHPALDDTQFARMRPVTIASRDGLALACYLTLPVNVDVGKDEEIKASRPAPLVVAVHDGPWSRDEWGFNRLHQFLANRGYAVLSVNFRGSTGFGKRFVNAGDREWGGAMQDDLIDAVRWAIDAGVADSKHIAIIGRNFGGYAALMGIARHSDVFACAVDIFGPPNLNTLLDAIPASWSTVADLFKRRIGDFTTPEGRAALLAQSPVSFTQTMNKPLMIVQGTSDPRTPRALSDHLVEALEKKSTPVTYLVLSEQSDDLSRPDDRLATFAAMEAFLARWMGGRAEPIGVALEASSLQVITGAEHAQGLAEAVRLQRSKQD